MNSYFVRVFVIPSAVFLSAIFGASYGSGREVMEFVSSHGPSGGIIALITVVVVHCLLLAISFEIARMYKSYDYVSFCKELLGPGWVLYEIVILMGMLIALSITMTVGGTVLEDHFGIQVWIGSLMIFALVVGLNYYGRVIVEKSMMISIAALFLVLVVLVVQLLTGFVARISEAFATHEYRSGGLMTGLKYAIGGGGYLPLLLYCAMGLRTRSEAFTAGVVAAVLAIVPASIFHLAFMVGYPEIVDQRLPTYWMFENISTPFMLNIYVIVMFVLVAQTGVAVMQGLIVRADGWMTRRSGKPLSRAGHAGVASAVVIISMALGSMGIIALILRGYTIMFMSFVVVYVVPLLTYGVYLVVRNQNEKPA